MTIATVAEKSNVFVQQGVSWEQFKAIQTIFDELPNVRLSYCDGVLEFVTLSKDHEAICVILTLLLGIYFEEREIEFFPSGAYSQIVEGKTEFQADLSYCFGTDKPVSDLSIEVIFTSGSINKLKKYQIKGVPEVWFWEDGVFSLYRLRADGYEQIDHSELLPGLNLDLLARCLLIDSKIQAMKEFRQGLQNR